ncbi:MAG: hypothetical protein PVI83_08100 [Lysobacterales bacterium]|jgi:hypothetical protein
MFFNAIIVRVFSAKSFRSASGRQQRPGRAGSEMLAERAVLFNAAGCCRLAAGFEMTVGRARFLKYS